MTRILLAGRHKLLTDGLRALFEKTDFRIVGATDVTEAGSMARQVEADVVVMDLLLQTLDGPSIIAQTTKQAPAAKIVVLSMSMDPSYISRAIAGGASAYVLKLEEFDELVRAIRAVVGGVQYLSPSLDDRAIREWQRTASVTHVENFNALTVRERQVLDFAVEGFTSVQIAQRLGISPRTAETHRSNIYKKLRLKSQADLIALALRRGLIMKDF
ncbi:MAG: DNA-binding response regulator, LuxR family [Betaproteobacteria bacterium]|jgi:DNA-binding NarL/FixJ family response regulator|nr:DNA-binding response regulator, LuxR family [Betaproteobacteria bacterium]